MYGNVTLCNISVHLYVRFWHLCVWSWKFIYSILKIYWFDRQLFFVRLSDAYMCMGKLNGLIFQTYFYQIEHIKQTKSIVTILIRYRINKEVSNVHDLYVWFIEHIYTIVYLILLYMFDFSNQYNTSNIDTNLMPYTTLYLLSLLYTCILP